MPTTALHKGATYPQQYYARVSIPIATQCGGNHAHSTTMQGKAGPQTHFTRVSMHYAKASMVAIVGGGGVRHGCASYAWTSVNLNECAVYFTKIYSLQAYSRSQSAYNQACDVETINRRDNHLSFHDCTLIHTSCT